jgi:hypothetical protein
MRTISSPGPVWYRTSPRIAWVFCFWLAATCNRPDACLAQDTMDGISTLLVKPFGVPDDVDYWGGVLDYLIWEKNSRESLELTPEQVVELRMLAKSIKGSEHSRRIYSELVKASGLDSKILTDEQKMKFAMRANQIRGGFFAEKASLVLLPHQMNLLTRGGVQFIRREHGDTGMLSSSFIRMELGIDEKQLNEIMEKAKEAIQIVSKKKSELFGESEKRLLELLTDQQREKLKRLEEKPNDSPEDNEPLERVVSIGKMPTCDPDNDDYWSEVVNCLVLDDGNRKSIELTPQQSAELKVQATTSCGEQAVWREAMVLWKEAGLDTRGEVSETDPRIREITITGEYRELMNQARRTCNRRFVDSVDTVLLPHQMKILNMQAIGFIRSQHGIGGLLKASFIREELEITDKQFDEIKAKVAEETRRLKEDVAKLEDEMREQILSVLTESQREKLKQLEEGR